MEETISGKNFHGFWRHSQKFIPAKYFIMRPQNILKGVIHESLFPRSISLYVDRESLFFQNLLNLSTQEIFFTLNP